MLDIKVKGQCVHSKLDGSAEELMQELVMLNIAVITNIVQNMDLKPNKSTLMAKLQMADTVNACVKNGLKMDITKQTTARDLIKDAWGLDMDEIQMEQMTMQEIIDKWLPIMDEHKLSNTEMTVMRREVKEAGFTMEQVIDKMIDIKTNKEVK